MTGQFENVLSAEIDKFACRTYEHLFGDSPENDITDEEFKQLVENTDYEVLLAGFPCQSFSRAGLGQGFSSEEKGIIFLHIVDIIERTRPRAIFLENVDHLITHNKGTTIKEIIDELELDLNYKIIGVKITEDGSLVYNARDFVRNSRYFGVPQNRPRTYLMGFDRIFYPSIDMQEFTLPLFGETVIYDSLNDVLEHPVAPKYYMSQGYFDTLVRHRERQIREGRNYGYKIINASGIEIPLANTLMATGGSGRERNLIIDKLEGIPGMIVPPKKSGLNAEYVRILTPTEWGKLQGFIGYGFVENGTDKFSFPVGITDNQKYKQFGNSVTIPVIEAMAKYMLQCFEALNDQSPEI
jgi:DNA (cytosine-5)-methyltransferase 1